MRKYIIALLTYALLIFAVGCSTTVGDIAEKNDYGTENGRGGEQLLRPDDYEEFSADIYLCDDVYRTAETPAHGSGEQLLHPDDHEEFSADIYLCDDVYRTAETPTHGSGTIMLPMAQDALTIEDYKILLCGDGCDPADVVSRASQGYALAYKVVAAGELDGNFRILKFKMEIPAPMVDELKEQGSYNNILEQIERNYHYLLILDEKHYAYIHLKDNEDSVNGTELADDVIKKATVQFESNPVKIELILPKVRELAYKGEELTWRDFERYNCRDIGSGLYILHFELDETFDLFVGGVPMPDEKPMYVKLALDADSDKYIDIRTDDINAFIEEAESYK